MVEKMNPEVKAAWLAALRSDEYAQGRNRLHNEHTNTYCCLGVVCELAVKKGVIAKAGGSYGINSDLNNYYLPLAVQQWAGIHSQSGEYGDNCLTALNDNGKSFAEIADIIEEKF